MATTTTSTTSSGNDTNNGSTQSWSNLPLDLLYHIATLLPSTRDLFAFASVSSTWRSAASTVMSSSPNHHFPPLLLGHFHGKPNSKDHRPVNPFTDVNFFDLTACKCSSAPYRAIPSKCFELPCFISSSHGHIIIFDKPCRSTKVLIIDFLTGHEIQSPPLPLANCEDFSINNCVALLTAPVSSEKCSLLLLNSKSLFLWQVHSMPEWARYPLGIPQEVCFEQMVLIGERIFALDSANTPFIISLRPHDLSVCKVLPKIPSSKVSPHDLRPHTSRLVDCGGELLCLCFHGWDELNFKVLRLDMSMVQPRWVEMEGLGNWAIFLGATKRIPSISCKNPERWGGRSNDVYLTSIVPLQHKLGLFNYYDGIEWRRKLPIVWAYPSKF